MFAAGNGWNGAAGGARPRYGDRSAGCGGKALSGFFAADGCAAGTDAIGKRTAGGPGNRAAAIAEGQRGSGPTDPYWSARSVRRPRAAQAGGAESGIERNGGDARRRAIAVDA